MNRLLIAIALSLCWLLITTPTTSAEPNLQNGKTKLLAFEHK